MPFDKVPDGVAWLAQDVDDAWYPQEVGRGCKASKAATAMLWGYEAEPNKQDHGGYENEVGRIVRLGQCAPPEDWEATLTRRESL